jgi:hypothetical protein
MEKRNVVEPKRTPCKRGFIKDTFCDCEDCLKFKAKRSKKASTQSVNINDIEGLARIHK